MEFIRYKIENYYTKYTMQFCALCFLFTLGIPMAASINESQIKAAYLVNFPNSVTWPKSSFESPDSPFYFCLLGDKDISNIVKYSLNNKIVNGRKVIVRTGDTLLEICHIIFISKSRQDLTANVISAIDGRNILTIGDYAEFAASGGMVNFFVEDKQINIAIDLTAILETELKLSTALVKMSSVSF